MMAQSAWSASRQRGLELLVSRQRGLELLVSRGYEPVLPVGSSFLAEYIPLHLVGLRGDYEILGVKLRTATGALSIPYVESLCRFEICQFRSLLTRYPGNIFIRCELWVSSPNGSLHCYEVLPDEVREVAAYV